MTPLLPLLMAAAQAASPAPDARPKVAMVTSKGTNRIALEADKAPVSTKNFLDYVRSGHYDGTIFHRVIPGFMAQGGGFDPQMKQKEVRAPIRNESTNGLSNRRGTLAMARTNDPNSATAQFFVNVVDNPRLDSSGGQPGYAVFGEVIEGMDVVDRIVNVQTTTRGMYQNVPSAPILIKSATVEGEAGRAVQRPGKLGGGGRRAQPTPAPTPEAP
jgi:cyclophilin family peptidyl-prolyl cis-trans isomerase